jgi:uncharacterized surface protein with fasciclin (FAS1) repeats
MELISLGLFLVVIVTVVHSQHVTEVLSSYSQLSKFTSYIAALPALSALLDTANNFTLLAPTDTAITTWLESTSNVSNSTIEASLMYHLLAGIYPKESLGDISAFIPTALSNVTYTNVTGGQRVEAVNNGSVRFISGNKETSLVMTPVRQVVARIEYKIDGSQDIFSTGGIIHIIDTVLEIPSTELETISNTNLSYFIEITNRGNFINAGKGAFVQQYNTRRDITVFAPNSAAALASFNTNGVNQSTLDTLFEYHVFEGLMYSTNFTNGTNLTTAAGLPVLVTIDDSGAIYLNSAKIINSDYLIYNGVMQVIDR